MSNLYDEISYPKFPKTEIGRKARFWYDLLWNKAVSIFEYEDLPDTVNRDYLETTLMSRGNVTWINDNEGNLRALYGAAYGFDCYGFPTTAEIANPVLGTIRGTFHLDAVWMRNNIYALPVQDKIFEYAMQLAQLDTNLKVNLDNLKTTTIFAVDNDAQATQVKDIYKKIVSGEPGLIVGDNLDFLSENKVNVFSSNIQYLGTQFLADRRTIINDFLTLFGINNIALEKKERLITGEVDSNDQELEINKYFWLKPREDAIAEVNKIFGTNIKVKMVEPEKIENVLMKGVEEDDNE